MRWFECDDLPVGLPDDQHGLIKQAAKEDHETNRSIGRG
jgi:hypothetical protein